MRAGTERSNDLTKFYSDLPEIATWDNAMLGTDIDNKFFGRSFNRNRRMLQQTRSKFTYLLDGNLCLIKGWSIVKESSSLETFLQGGYLGKWIVMLLHVRCYCRFVHQQRHKHFPRPWWFSWHATLFRANSEHVHVWLCSITSPCILWLVCVSLTR